MSTWVLINWLSMLLYFSCQTTKSGSFKDWWVWLVNEWPNLVFSACCTFKVQSKNRLESKDIQITADKHSAHKVSYVTSPHAYLRVQHTDCVRQKLSFLGDRVYAVYALQSKSSQLPSSHLTLTTTSSSAQQPHNWISLIVILKQHTVV